MLTNQLSMQYSAISGYKMDKKSSRALILILTTLTYLLLGAAVFGELENGEEGRLREEIAQVRERLQRKYNFTEQDMELFELVSLKGIPHKAGLQWHFAGALYFSAVVVTTVGYGHSAPETAMGKLFCMVFALGGIPMGLIMFQSIGERVNTGIAYCLHKLRGFLRAHGCPCLMEVTPTHLLVVSLSIGTTIIVVGTYVFHNEERWTLFDAYYYCFITLSTIGFGDYVPLQQGGALQARPGYVVFTLLFVLVGLAVFSACVNLLVLGFMAPNSDEVTAARRDPPSAIVLERFARSGSLVDSQLFGMRRPSAAPLAKRSIRQWSIPRDIGAAVGSPNEHKPSFASSLCSICLKPRLKRPSYSVRLPPTRNIGHLIGLD